MQELKYVVFKSENKQAQSKFDNKAVIILWYWAPGHTAS